MRSHWTSTAVLLACCLLAVASADIDFNNPVRSAAEDEVTSMPGLDYKPNFKHYSGYLQADAKNPTNRFWHYWFVESQSDPSKDPLVLWLNGGPGCSSLLGLLTELGPFAITADGKVVDNPYAWNKNANVIFMESPAGVGFSYAADGDITADDDTTARQNHQALRSFLNKFPQYENRSIYLTGESYGGVYLPTLGVLVDKDPSMNLKGVAIGNGYLDANRLAESLIFFSYYHGLIGETTWAGLAAECCKGSLPTPGGCQFLDPARSSKCDKYVADATDAIINSGLNPYNLYDRCAQPQTDLLRGSQGGKQPLSREHFDKSLMLQAFNVSSSWKRRSFASKPRRFEILRGDPPCENDGIVINYLNQPAAREALHIPVALKTPFTTCFDGIKYTMIYPGKKDGLMPQMKELLASKRNLRLMVYNGDVDMMCNFLGDEWFVDALGRRVVADYSPWHVDDQIAGFVKHYDGIVYTTIKGSGHMVPTDRPKEALFMFQNFIKERSD